VADSGMRATPRDNITSFCNDILKLHSFPDYGPMGLQFQGKDEVRKVACAVSVSKDIIERTAAADADLLIVHHGMFWNNESRILDERVGGRIDLLEQYGITLLGYHLALDAHPKIGNNVLLAKALGLKKLKPWADIGWGGELKEPYFLPSLYAKLSTALGLSDREGTLYNFGNIGAKKISVIAGGAAHYVVQAHRDGFDTFVTGEPAEPTLYLARDLKMNVLALGHDKTERSGVQALAKMVAKEFNIPWHFLADSNPV